MALFFQELTMNIKTILGISAGYHDAAISVIDNDGEILFAGHSERYSKIKHDGELCPEIFNEVNIDAITDVAYYERPFIKQCRRLYSGEGVELNKLTLNQVLNQHFYNHLPQKPTQKIKHHCFNHHLSHAAGGFQTSPFNSALCIVIDAIGEFDTITAWDSWYDDNGNAKYKQVYSKKYPHSIGLFYSAITQFVGLKPKDEEYILMGMAAYGDVNQAEDILNRLRRWNIIKPFASYCDFSINFHRGIVEGGDKKLGMLYDILSMERYTKYDIALFAQLFIEGWVKTVIAHAIPREAIKKHTNFVFFWWCGFELCFKFTITHSIIRSCCPTIASRNSDRLLGG